MIGSRFSAARNHIESQWLKFNRDLKRKERKDVKEVLGDHFWDNDHDSHERSQIFDTYRKNRKKLREINSGRDKIIFICMQYGEPGINELSRALNVNPRTITRTYEKLRGEVFT